MRLCDEVDVCALGFRALGDALVSPLCVAVYKQHVDVVAMLISNGADVNAGTTLKPIGVALISGNIELVRLLISAGADVNAVCT